MTARPTGRSGRLLRRATLALGALGVLAAPLAAELRIARPDRPPTDRWRQIPVGPHGATRLGISFRPRQVEALGLDARATLHELLDYPYQLIRLGAYWDRIEPAPGTFRLDELDWQIDAAERAGKQIILCLGAVKTFGYPETFVPAHRLGVPLREGRLITPSTHPALLAAATAHVARLVERYSARRAIVAWQVEHEAVDPLGMEHSWRLAADFVAAEVAAVRAADPARPVMLNGFLPTSLPVRLQQGWRTRDQGDSLAVAQRLADIVGIDYYPCHALASIGPGTLYLDGGDSPWQRRRWREVAGWGRGPGKAIMISEGQAEPWEAVTTPPAPRAREMYSCPPERLIANYNRCLRLARRAGCRPEAYLFWGAEYWVLRRQGGDERYLGAFARILGQA